MPAALAAAIFVASLLLVLLRPPRVPDCAAALGGGAAMALATQMPWEEVAQRLLDQWNVFLFFFGLSLASATADRAGVFRYAAQFAVRWAGGSQQRLLIGVYAICVAVSVVLSNDATALLLTPVVFAVATRAGVDPRPYAFACALVANAASFVLPVSNPSNLLIISRAPLPLGTFLASLLLPSVLALAATLIGLLLVFRTHLAATFRPVPTAEPLHSRTRMIALGIAVLAAAYVAAAAKAWPLGLVASVGGLVLVALDALANAWEPRALAREVAWPVFPLFAGLLLLVGGGERAGLFAPVEQLVATAAGQPALGPPALTLTLALLTNVLNNLPTALVVASALGSLPATTTRDQLAAAAIVGVNLGPNLTTIGSLATMLWLLLLRRRGMDVSPLAYLRIGVAVTAPALLAAALGVWLAVR